MKQTLEQILQNVGAFVDQDPTTPTGTDLTTRVAYSNRTLNKWSDFYDWRSLVDTYEFTIDSDGKTTLTLPDNYIKPMSKFFAYDGSLMEITIIDASQRGKMSDSAYYAYIQNNGSYQELVYPRGLASGASAYIDIKIQPSAFSASGLAYVPPLTQAEYIVQDVIAQVLESRSDERFPIEYAKAENMLVNMVEDQNAGNLGMNYEVPRDTSFVIGVD